ncbi:FxSxx-COOH system tetratricopeptide repeat protein [Luedemannella helvata]|uniref:Uncharacterized protein n=1 Tax=Luedemannella helvata TaxID=349315 RepID=A0ABN2KE23_9ACTN
MLPFFLSHQHSLSDEPSGDVSQRHEYLVRRFFRDLSEEVRAIMGVASRDRVGYLADPVAAVPERSAMLRNCHTMIALLSPRYVADPLCAQDIATFQQPDAAPAAARRRLLPIFWEPTDVPANLDAIQHADPLLNAAYRQHGLRRLMVADDYRSDYVESVNAVALRVVQAVGASRVEPERPPAPQAQVPADPSRHGQIITFYSFKGGVGRTMALANIAWILASTGRSVLAVDWDLESPGLHRYFAPFLADRDLRQSPGVFDAIWRFVNVVMQPAEDGSQAELSVSDIRKAAQARRYATSLERYEFPRGGTIDFMPAGRQGADYSRTLSHFDWDQFYTRLHGDQFLLALADDMRANYDVVLIDSRTGLSDSAGICTVTLPDIVVNCFTYNNQSIEGAAAAARSITVQSRGNVRVYPVPTRVEDGEATKLDRRRSLAQQRFADHLASLGYPDPTRYWGQVEIPYKIFYAYEETLATFGDPPYQQNTLLASYERLAGELFGEPIGFDGVPEPVRRGWLTEFEQRGSAIAGTLMIAYMPRERVWAEWIAYQLRLVGQRSNLRDLNDSKTAVEALGQAERAIVVLSVESAKASPVRTWWEHAVTRDVPGQWRFLVPVRLDGQRMPSPYDSHEPVDMYNVTEADAVGALLARLGLRDALQVTEPLGGGPRPRFPFTPARVWRVPSRNTGFVGRDTAMERLRERLNSSTAQTGPAVLQGIGGVGKTQIAVEYLHRFAADYDVVWWISAEQPALILTELANLAQELELPVAERLDDQVGAVLEALRLGRPSARWLLVFDNNDDPEQLRPFIPIGGGDVIITTPGQEWSREAWTLDVNVFERSESVSLLMNRVVGLAEPDAEEIAEKLGDLPLAVEQAASWLAATAMSARGYLDLLDQQLPKILNEPPPPGYRHAAAETWRLSQERLRQSSRAAAHLTELCAFFGPEPIPTRLIDSPGMAALLAADDPNLRDSLVRGSLIREITRFGLVRVDPAIHALRMHRLVQSVLRNDLSESERVSRQRQVHVILAADTRGEPDDSKNWPTYQGLLPHLEPSGALDTDDSDVQQFVIDMIRYLRYRGDLSSAQALGDRADKAWSARSGDTNKVAVLRVRSELGNILHARGRYQDALRLQGEASVGLTRALGETHPYALIAVGGQAAAQRGLGNYRAARDLDELSAIRWQATLGDNHARTLIAKNNLAVSLRLTGDFAGALREDEELVRASERAGGSSSWWTLLFRVNLGRDLRETGDLLQSKAVLEKVESDCRAVLGDQHSRTLSAAKNRVITMRRLGLSKDHLQLIDDTVAESERTSGPRHPSTLLCALEAACVRSALGQHDEALSRAETVVSAYREILGADNPVTLASVNDHAVFLLRRGDAAEALRELVDTASRFRTTLGTDHPYVLTCETNLATAHFAVGNHAKANQIDQGVHGQLRAIFNDSHPAVLAAAANLAASEEALGHLDAAFTLREETTRLAIAKLGVEHPNVQAIRDGERITSDIDPPEA